MSVYSDSFTKDILENKNTSLSKIYSLLDKKSKYVLDVGCSAGYFGNFIKNKNKSVVYGIEIDKKDAILASSKLDKVYSFNLEEIKNFKQIKEKFDAMIFADVLEHTRNPEQVLKNLTNKLKLDGQVIISFPNITHQSTILEIISGQWNLENSGIHDKTHLRYFDLRSLVNLIENSGLSVEKVDYILFDLPKNKLIEILKKQNIKPTKEILKILKKPYSKVFQYIISARKRKTAIKFNITQNTLKPASDWINEWGTIYKNYKVYKGNWNRMYTKLMEQELILNKIYNSKTWKLLNLYKKCSKKTIDILNKLK